MGLSEEQWYNHAKMVSSKLRAEIKDMESNLEILRNRVKELEEENERLRNKKCVHDLANEYLNSVFEEPEVLSDGVDT